MTLTVPEPVVGPALAVSVSATGELVVCMPVYAMEMTCAPPCGSDMGGGAWPQETLGDGQPLSARLISMVLFGGVPVDALRTIHVAVLDVPAGVLDVAGTGVTLMAFAGGACAVTDTPTIAEPDGDVASGAVEVADNTSGCGDDVGYPPLKVTHTVADWPGNSVMGR